MFRRILLASVISAPFALPAFGANAPSLEALLAEAIAKNPQLIEAVHRERAAAAMGEHEALLEDPELMGQTMGIPPGPLPAMRGVELGISRRVPHPDRFRAKAEAGKLAGLVARYEARALKADIVEQIKRDYAELYYLHQAIAATERTKALLESAAKTARAQYAVGSGLQQDALSAQVSLIQTMAEIERLRDEERQSRIRLNMRVGRSPSAPLGAVSQLPKPRSIDAKSVPSRLGDSPWIELAAVREAERRAWYQASHTEHLPEYRIGIGVRSQEMMGTGFMGSFGMSLPRLNKRRLETHSEATYQELKAAEAARAQARLAEEAKVATALSQRELAERQIALYRSGLIPQATQAYRASLASYQVAKLPFSAVLANRQALYAHELGLARQEASLFQATAILEAALGLD